MSILLLLYGPGEVVAPAPTPAPIVVSVAPGGALALEDQPRRKRLPPYVIMQDFVELEDEDIIILIL